MKLHNTKQTLTIKLNKIKVTCKNANMAKLPCSVAKKLNHMVYSDALIKCYSGRDFWV